MSSPMKSLRMPPDLDAIVEAHRMKHGLAYAGAMIDLMRRGWESTQPKRPPPPAPTVEAKRVIPDGVPAWMRRGFETGQWR